MNNGTFSKIMMIGFSVLAIAACSKKKGNSAVAVPPAVGVCQIGPNGVCVGQVGYQGNGRWNGHLNVVNMPLYLEFARMNNLCGRYGCNQPTQFVGISLRVTGPQGRVTITPYEYSGWSRHRLVRQANVTASTANAFNVVLMDPNYYIQGGAPGVINPQIYPQPIVPSQNQVQLAVTIGGAYGEITHTTLIYRGVVVASGQLQGQRW